MPLKGKGKGKEEPEGKARTKKGITRTHIMRGVSSLLATDPCIRRTRAKCETNSFIFYES